MTNKHECSKAITSRSTIFISPHKTSHEWAETYFPCDKYEHRVSRRFLRRLPPSEIFGQLAVPLAALACEFGHTYYHLMIPNITLLGASPTARQIQSTKPYFTRFHLETLDNMELR
jgi:hypothetical protein